MSFDLPRGPPSTSLPDAAEVDELRAFVLELGRSLSLAGTAVSETQERLMTIAQAGGAHERASWCCRRR